MTDPLAPIVEAIAERLVPRIAELVAESLPAPEAGELWRLLTVDEAASRLGRSTRWVRDHKDAIGWVRLDGGALAFELDDLRRFARERRIACKPLAAVEDPLRVADSTSARLRARQKVRGSRTA